MAIATYVVNGTRLTVDMKAPLAEAQKLISADPLTKGIILTPIAGFGSYSSNTASAGVDAGSGHVDFDAEHMSDAQAQRCVTYLRRVGIMAYFRPRSWWSWWKKAIRRPGWQRHIHCLLIDSKDLSQAARDQIKEWIAGGDALVGPEADNGDRSVVGRTWTQYVALVAKAAQNVGQSVAVMAKVKLLQKALRLAADGVWGPVTEAMCVGTVTISGGGKARFNRYTLPNRKAMQRAWGCRIIDGRWGPQTQAANRAAIIAMQKALGVKADGDWGPLTDRAYRALRVKAYRP